MKEDKKPDRDELTEKMHSEFEISEEQERKIRVWMAREAMKEFNRSIEYVCKMFNLKEEDFKNVEHI